MIHIYILLLFLFLNSYIQTGFAESYFFSATETGLPINRPIWWLDPTDNFALGVDSEFLLGDDILVAPVLEEGAVDRDVYLPVGLWQDANTKNILEVGMYVCI